MHGACIIKKIRKQIKGWINFCLLPSNFLKQ